MHRLFVFGLLSSVGQACLWLSLGPYLESANYDLGQIGSIGLVRQFAFLGGAIVAGPWADSGFPEKKCLLLEILQGIAALLLFLAIAFNLNLPPSITEVWVAARFFLGGLAFVMGFKLFSKASASIGSSAIVHLISTQGAMLFGASISLIAPFVFKNSFLFNIFLDMSTSAILSVYLWRLTRHQSVDNLSTIKIEKISFGFVSSISSIWAKEVRFWGALQILSLTMISGFLISSIHFSTIQSLVSHQTAFSLINLFYGAGIWITGIGVHRSKSKLMPGFVGTLLVGASSVIGFMTDSSNSFLNAASLLSFAFGAGFMLHFTNKQILDRTHAQNTGRMRSSMLFYLSIIFGIGEKLVGETLSNSNGVTSVSVVRLGIGTIVLVMLLFSQFRAQKPFFN